MHGYSKLRSTEGRGFFRPWKSACRLSLLCYCKTQPQSQLASDCSTMATRKARTR
jgi:hypothetical protein